MLSPEDYQKCVLVRVRVCTWQVRLFSCVHWLIIQEHELRLLILSFFVDGAGEGGTSGEGSGEESRGL
jgi:hypothetical protein